MELATMPHHSSTISATVGTFSPDASGEAGPPGAGAATAAATGSSSRAPVTSSGSGAQQRQHLQSGGTVEAGAASARVRRHEQPHKSASDSRVAALVADAREGANNRDGTDELGDEYEALKYGASHVVHLFVPVSLCMAVVILAVKTVGFFSEKDGHYLPYTPFHSDTEDTGTLLVQSIGNALVMLAFVVIVTVMLVLLYYYRFYKVIYGWLVLSTIGLLTTFSFTFVYEVFKNYNIPLDYLSLSIFLWNWSMVGMVCIHWKGPLMLQQFYLIFVSALMALLFIKYLPDWSVWTVLAMLSIWDLVAVLCPKGPLRILVETTQERNEAILPALVYSSTVLYAYVIYGVVAVAAATGAGGNDANGDQLQPPLDEDERHGINNDAAGSQNLSAVDQHQTSAAGGDGSASSTTDAALLLPRSTGLGVDAVTTTSGIAATSSSSSMTMTATTVVAAHQRRGRSTGTSDDSANTLLTTVLTGGSVGEQRTRTVSSSGHHQHRSCTTAPRTSRSRSPRHPASERGVPSAGTGGGATGTVMSEEERGVKLGLGDFIFYSVLVGKASSYGDWNVTIACYVAILVGLAFTLMLLALFHKALPALPISIFSGIIFFFATRLLITPFLDCVSVRQILL